jgi:hypothetical protein
MNKTIKRPIVTLLITSLFVFSMTGVYGGVQAQDSYPPAIEPHLSTDGLTLYNAFAPQIVGVDPNPAMQGIKIPLAPELEKALADPAAASATFSITFVAAGGTDFWGQVCTTFPENAKTAFNAAAAIWASTVQSSVPISLQACWANLSDPGIPGYSSWLIARRDFSGAPQANTWYEGSLANALHGSDLDPTSFDLGITDDSNFAWYYGTDSNPPVGQYDLVTAVAKQIASGLNFSGSAGYSGGTGQFGLSGSPFIYDKFMEDNGGMKLTSYTNPSTALGTLLTSGSLWFNGSNANAANGSSRVKIYAPGTWADGSSYSHLDYDTFAGTADSLMVYTIASGSANHNPGPVTKGLLKDLGWILAIIPPTAPTGVSATDGTYTDRVSISWSASSGATYYEVYRNTSNSSSGAALLGSPSASPYNDTSATAGTTYWYFVKACNTAGCSGYSSSDSGYRSPGAQTVYVMDVFTTDQDGTAIKTDFRAGETMLFWIEVINEYQTAQEAYFEWIVLDPGGHDVPALEWTGNLTTDPGDLYWTLKATVPAGSSTGAYTYIGRITFPAANGNTTYDTSSFNVIPQGRTTYLPLAIRAPSVPTYFEGPWEAEPNNSYLEANGPLRSNKDYYGYLNDYKDYFSIKPVNGGQIVIDLTNVSVQEVQLQLFYQIADVDHRKILVTAAPYHIEYTGEPGTYYIYIYTEKNFNSSVPYTLRVTYP